jgi:hypothetical protein
MPKRYYLRKDAFWGKAVTNEARAALLVSLRKHGLELWLFDGPEGDPDDNQESSSIEIACNLGRILAGE